MKKISGWALALSLGLSSAGSGLTAGAAGLKARKAAGRATAAPADNLKTAAKPAADEAVALLPKSDVVIVVDVNRLLTEVLPKVKTAWPQQSEKMVRELNEFMTEAAKTGVDFNKVKTVSIGLSMFSQNVTGALIVDGAALNAATMEAYAKSHQEEKAAVSNYKGKTIYLYNSDKKKDKDKDKDKAKDKAKESGDSPIGALAASLPGNLNLMDANTAIAQLDQTRVVIGDQAQVKTVIDTLTGGGTPANNLSAELSGALKETSSGSFLRFAVNLPDSARQWMSDQEYVKDLAVMKMVFGTMDVSDDLSLTLEAKLRTGSKAEATKLESTLNGFLAIGKMMLGSNEDPTMKLVTQLLSEIKIGAQTADVSLALKVPRALYEQALKSEQKSDTKTEQKSEQNPSPPKSDKP